MMARTERLTVAAVIVACLALSSTTADACTCAGYPDDVKQAVALAYSHSDAVFVGEVTSDKLTATDR